MMKQLIDSLMGRKRVLIDENERAVWLYKGEVRGILRAGQYAVMFGTQRARQAGFEFLRDSGGFARARRRNGDIIRAPADHQHGEPRQGETAPAAARRPGGPPRARPPSNQLPAVPALPAP